jgi:hypothetical protein
MRQELWTTLPWTMRTRVEGDTMQTPKEINYSNGLVVSDPVIQVWDDLHEERSGYYRAFWCDGPDATTGSPIIGYCSSGGSYRSIKDVAREAWRMYPDAKIYRNGREMKKEIN